MPERGGYIIGTYGGTIHKTDKDFNIGEYVNVEKNEITPKSFTLFQNYPNPFNPETNIKYYLGANSKVSLEIIDLNGKIVKEGYRGYQPAGYHTYKWSGMNQKDEIMPSGIYIYKVEANGYIQTGKMVLMK